MKTSSKQFSNGTEPEGESDFMQMARNAMTGNFPKMRRMKRRLKVEIAVMVLLVFILGWVTYLFPAITMWLTLPVTAVVGVFLALQILAFRAYWYTPADADHAIAYRKIADRFGIVKNVMIIVRVSLFVLTVAFLCIHLVIPVLTWQVVVLLILIQVGFSVFSSRWIAYAREATRNAAAFEKIKSVLV